VDGKVDNTIFGRIRHGMVVAIGAVALTAAFFLVLPLIQAIAKGPSSDLVVTSMSVADVPPPPPPPEEQPEEEEEEEEPPPEMAEEMPQLDLSQLELALNPGLGGDYLAGDATLRINTAAVAEAASAVFSQSDLDQAPLPVHQTPPALTAAMKQRAPGSVVVIFEVDQTGRVQNPRVRSSSDPIFDSAVLAAIRQWRFEPGKRNGEPVRTRMLQPFTIPR
jgi:protein TonB